MVCHGGNSPVNPTNPALGPSWVGSIVNAIGQGIAGSTCDPLNASIYWANTVILVTWDDWGGLYDHVKPPIGYPNGTGSQYVYGFRVPLLVVSAYSPKRGYVSGAVANHTIGACPTEPSSRFCHDFGSILNFIEFTFGKGGKSLGEIYPAYHYADYFAMDGPNNATCLPTTCPYGLSDFFNFRLPPAAFTPISTPYDADYFITYSGPESPPGRLLERRRKTRRGQHYRGRAALQRRVSRFESFRASALVVAFRALTFFSDQTERPR